MTNRFPLIFNGDSDQIQELAADDNLDLQGSGIRNGVGAQFTGVVTATTFDGNATTATNASGLTGTPSITVQDVTAEMVSIAGTLTYEDVTNIDSIGIVTARSGVHFGATGNGTLVVGDSEGIGIGTADPARLLTLNSAGDTFLSIKGGTDTSEPGILFGDPSSDSIGQIRYANNGDFLKFETNSGERVRISSAGILTCFGPIAAQGGNSATGGFQLTDTSGVLRPRITSDGDNATVIRSGSATGGVKFNNFANSAELAEVTNGGVLLIGATSTFASSASELLQIQNTNGGKIALSRNKAAITDGNDIGEINFYGNEGTARQSARIVCSADADQSDTSSTGRLTFFTTPASTVTPVERLRIDSIGDFRFNNAALIEQCEIDSTGRNGVQAVNLSAGMVYNITGASAGTWTPNFRISGTVSLNSVMSVGDCISPCMIVAKGATTHFSNSIQIDGSAVTPEFLGGAPTEGGDSGTFDIYSYTIIKTADATFSAFASVSTYS